jgi:hypothetical protein
MTFSSFQGSANLGARVLQLAGHGDLSQYRIPRLSANNGLPSEEAMRNMSE